MNAGNISTQQTTKRWAGMLQALLVVLTAWAAMSSGVGTAQAAIPINITYTDALNFGFNDPTYGAVRRTAFEAAVDNWRQRLIGTVPIEVKAHFETSVGSNPGYITLAYAGPVDLKRDMTGLPIKNTWYPVALANQFLKTDSNPPGTFDTDGTDLSYDIEITFNADLDTSYPPLRWYYGLDARPPRLGTDSDGNPIEVPDFYSTAMHELGHGLGFISLTASDGTYAYGGGLPAIYDQFMAYGFSATATRLVNLTAAQRAIALLSGQLTFAGPNARAAQNNVSNVRLYAPFVYEPGSSTSHLDETTYSGGINELMTPTSTNALHDPGPVGTGVFRDLGWGLADSTATVVPAATDPPNTGAGLIAFTSNRDGNNEIYLVDASGANLKRLTTNSANDRQPALSADGKTLAFVSNRDGNNEIYTFTIGTTDAPKRITNSSSDDLYPTWNPAGTKLAFASIRSGLSQIYSMNADGTNVVRLTTSTATDTQPAWSPGGDLIAFVSNRSGVNQIYTMSAIDGSGVVLRAPAPFATPTAVPTATPTPVAGATPTATPTPTVTPTPAPINCSQPAWNAGGSKLAFISTTSSGVELNTMLLTGGTRTVLTQDMATDAKPSYSPYAEQIVFSSDLYGRRNLTLIDDAGTNRLRLTKGEYDDSEPSWSKGGASSGNTTPTPTATPVPGATPPNNDIIASQAIAGDSGTLLSNGVAVPAAARTNMGATKEAGEPDHAGNAGGASVWYRWTAPSQTGNAVFSTNGSDFDTLVAIYTSNNSTPATNALTLVAQNNDTTNTAQAGQKTSEVSYTVQPNTVYYIAVDGLGAASGNIALSWTFAAGPPNDNIAFAANLASPSPAELTNVGATKQSGEPNHAQAAGGASVWYKIDITKSGTATVSTAGSTFDTLLGVYTAGSPVAVSTLTAVASNDDDGLLTTSKVSWSAVTGTTYYIAVDGYAAASGVINLTYTLAGRQPDLKVRNPSDAAGVYADDNAYTTTETSVQYPTAGSQATFLIPVENDGDIPDVFNVTGVAGNANFTVRYYDAAAGGNDITSAITGSGWKTPAVAVGAAANIRLEILASAGTPNDTTLTLPLTATVDGISTLKDIAAAQVVVVTRKPDVMSKIEGGAIFTGDGTYNSDGANQKVAQSVATGATSKYAVRVRNDGSIAEKYVLTAVSSGGSSFTRKYLLNGADVTSEVEVPTGHLTASIAPKAFIDLSVEVTPSALTVPGTVDDITFTAASNEDRTKLDTNVLSTTATVAAALVGRDAPPSDTPPVEKPAEQFSKVQLSSAGASALTNTIALQFAGALNQASATDKSHYKVAVNGSGVAVTQAFYSSASQTVILVLPPGSLETGDAVVVQWTGLRDTLGLPLVPGQTSFTIRNHMR